MKKFKQMMLSVLLIAAGWCIFAACSNDESSTDDSKKPNEGISNAETNLLDGAWKRISEEKYYIDAEGNRVKSDTYVYNDEKTISLLMFNIKSQETGWGNIEYDRQNPLWFVFGPYPYLYDEKDDVYYFSSRNGYNHVTWPNEPIKILSVSKSHLTIEKKVKDRNVTRFYIYQYERVNNVEEMTGTSIVWSEPKDDDVTVAKRNVKENRLLIAEWENNSGVNLKRFTLYSDESCVIEAYNQSDRLTTSKGKWSYDKANGLLALTTGQVLTIKSLNVDMLVAEYSLNGYNSTATWTPKWSSDPFEELFLEGTWEREDGSTLSIHGRTISYAAATGEKYSGTYLKTHFSYIEKDRYSSEEKIIPAICWTYNGEEHYFGLYDYYCCGPIMKVDGREMIQTDNGYKLDNHYIAGIYKYIE